MISLLLFLALFPTSSTAAGAHDSWVYGYTPEDDGNGITAGNCNNNDNGLASPPPDRCGQLINQLGNKNYKNGWDRSISACGGAKQSPVNINSRDTVPLETRLLLNSPDVFPECKVKLKTKGYSFQMDPYGNYSHCFDKYTAVFENETYYFLQWHMHGPSEHSLNGEKFELEMHHVFTNRPGDSDAAFTKLLVIGVFIEGADASAEHDDHHYHDTPFMPLFPEYSKSDFDAGHNYAYVNHTIPEGESPIFHLGDDSVKNAAGQHDVGAYYHYEGSLTTPPCLEIVSWFVLEEHQAWPQSHVDLYFDRMQHAINETVALVSDCKELFAFELPARTWDIENGGCSTRLPQDMNGRTLYYHAHNPLGAVDEWVYGYTKDDGACDAEKSVDCGQLTMEFPYMNGWDRAVPECGGDKQSPINLNSRITTPLDTKLKLKSPMEMPECKVKLKTKGYSFQMDAYEDLSECFDDYTAEFDGETYYFYQWHMHGPSEHSLNGEKFELEMHHVFTNKPGTVGYTKLLVIGVFIEPSTDTNDPNYHNSPFLTKFPEYTAKDKFNGHTYAYASHTIPAGSSPIFHLGSDKLQGGEHDLGAYYHYEGSLTTPPCAEIVSWFVLEEHQYWPQSHVNRYFDHMQTGINQGVSMVSDCKELFSSNLPAREWDMEHGGCSTRLPQKLGARTLYYHAATSSPTMEPSSNDTDTTHTHTHSHPMLAECNNNSAHSTLTKSVLLANIIVIMLSLLSVT